MPTSLLWVTLAATWVASSAAAPAVGDCFISLGDWGGLNPTVTQLARTMCRVMQHPEDYGCTGPIAVVVSTGDNFYDHGLEMPGDTTFSDGKWSPGTAPASNVAEWFLHAQGNTSGNHTAAPSPSYYRSKYETIFLQQFRNLDADCEAWAMATSSVVSNAYLVPWVVALGNHDYSPKVVEAESLDGSPSIAKRSKFLSNAADAAATATRWMTSLSLTVDWTMLQAMLAAHQIWLTELPDTNTSDISTPATTAYGPWVMPWYHFRHDVTLQPALGVRQLPNGSWETLTASAVPVLGSTVNIRLLVTDSDAMIVQCLRRNVGDYYHTAPGNGTDATSIYAHSPDGTPAGDATAAQLQELLQAGDKAGALAVQCAASGASDSDFTCGTCNGFDTLPSGGVASMTSWPTSNLQPPRQLPCCEQWSWLQGELQAADAAIRQQQQPPQGASRSRFVSDVVLVAGHHAAVSPDGFHEDLDWDWMIVNAVGRAHAVSTVLMGHNHLLGWSDEGDLHLNASSPLRVPPVEGVPVLAPTGGQLTYIITGAGKGHPTTPCSYSTTPMDAALGMSRMTTHAVVQAPECMPFEVNDHGAFTLHRVEWTQVTDDALASPLWVPVLHHCAISGLSGDKVSCRRRLARYFQAPAAAPMQNAASDARWIVAIVLLSIAIALVLLTPLLFYLRRRLGKYHQYRQGDAPDVQELTDEQPDRPLPQVNFDA